MDPEGEGEAQSLTCRFDTTHGELTYAERADAIAQEFHREIVGSNLPDLAGRWRRESVQVGVHVPPEHFLVPMRMRQYADSVRTRLEFATSLDLQIEWGPSVRWTGWTG